MRISDQVEIIERGCRQFPPEEFIFWVGVHDQLLMTAEKRQTRFFREDLQQVNAVLFPEEVTMVMPFLPDCQLLLLTNGSVKMNRKGKKQSILSSGKYTNREMRHLIDGKFLVSSFNEPHRILEYLPDR